MRALPSPIATALAEGVATLCLCWKVIRRDGVVLGFTDHDADLVIDGTTFHASSGFTASEAAENLGLAVNNTEVQGALSSDAITEQDIARGLYDDARVEQWLVNWRDPDQRYLLQVASIGRVSRGEQWFEAEMRGLSHYLNQTRGRVYSRLCDAVFGDARCGKSAAAYTTVATITAVHSGQKLTVAGIGSYPSGWFSAGVLTFVDGPAAGEKLAIRHHEAGVVELWRAPAVLPQTGNAVRLLAGCDKRLATCIHKFGNAANFRGFPHIPGNDYLLRYATKDDPANDGKPVIATY